MNFYNETSSHLSETYEPIRRLVGVRWHAGANMREELCVECCAETTITSLDIGKPAFLAEYATLQFFSLASPGPRGEGE